MQSVRTQRIRGNASYAANKYSCNCTACSEVVKQKCTRRQFTALEKKFDVVPVKVSAMH